MNSLTPNFSRLHDPYCSCFECMPDHADALLSINNWLGFGVKIGDTIETNKVVLLYDGKSGVKAVSPPRNYIVSAVNDKFVNVKSIDNGVAMGFINNDPNTYVKIPPILKNTVLGANAVQEKIEDIASKGFDLFGDLWGTIKWVLIGVIALLLLLVILRFTGK